MNRLQFSQNLEELAHGVRPGHADILVLEYEEIAIPRLVLATLCPSAAWPVSPHWPDGRPWSR